ncbi:uncharacterized protein [Nicotiana tomentosiformis]|uniref:uncharacterized protein n=1 Tax=Nicotiana tomentosiformis TaxID=4098 RepID=UPI00388C6BF0
MAKISKTVLQKEAASSSWPADEKTVVEPRLEELIPAGHCLYADTVPHLENWVRSLFSTSTYAERAWHGLSKGWWEARTHGFGKDAFMRSPSGDEEALPPISKPEKVIKRKRASDSEGQKPNKRAARKPKVNIIPLTMESVLNLRDEEEEEEIDSGSVARARAVPDTQNTSVSVEVDTAPSRLDEVEEETLTQVPEPRGTEDVLPRGKETVEEVVDAGVQTELESPQDGGGSQKDLLRAIEIGDSTSFPSFSQLMIRDAQAVETCRGEGAYGEEDPFRGYFIGVENVTCPSDLEAPKKSSSEVRAPYLFNEAQHALNRAFVLHHEVFFQSRRELSQYEAEVRRLTEERDAFKLLSEQREGEVKRLRVELKASRKEQAELADGRSEIRGRGMEEEHGLPRLRKGDCPNSTGFGYGPTLKFEREVLVQAEKIEEFQSQLSSANSDRERLSTELEAAKSEVEKAVANADAMVAVYRSDVEAAQVRAKEVAEAAQAQAIWVVEHAKCWS